MRVFIVLVGSGVYFVPATARLHAEAKVNLIGATTIGVLDISQTTDSIQGPFAVKLCTDTHPRSEPVLVLNTFD